MGQSPFYLPTVVGANVTLCPEQTAIVEVVPDTDQTFVAYQWVSDWQGGGGTVVNGQETSIAELTAGVYQLTVTDGSGCQGRYTFPIAETSVNIPDLTLEPTCDFSEEAGLDSLVFEGGFSSVSRDIILRSCCLERVGTRHFWKSKSFLLTPPKCHC